MISEKNATRPFLSFGRWDRDILKSTLHHNKTPLARYLYLYLYVCLHLYLNLYLYDCLYLYFYLYVISEREKCDTAVPIFWKVEPKYSQVYLTSRQDSSRPIFSTSRSNFLRSPSTTMTGREKKRRYSLNLLDFLESGFVLNLAFLDGRYDFYGF